MEVLVAGNKQMEFLQSVNATQYNVFHKLFLWGNFGINIQNIPDHKIFYKAVDTSSKLAALLFTLCCNRGLGFTHCTGVFIYIYPLHENVNGKSTSHSTTPLFYLR